MFTRIHPSRLAAFIAPLAVLALAPPAVNADTIHVCWDGTYTGSYNGGLYFHSGEIADAAVDAFTITNGYGDQLYGGGILLAHWSEHCP